MKVMLKFSDRYRFGKVVWIYVLLRKNNYAYGCYSNKYNINIEYSIYTNRFKQKVAEVL